MRKSAYIGILVLFIVTTIVRATVFQAKPKPAAAAPPIQAPYPYEDRSDPVLLIQSYYNAIILRDYARAYSYWDSAPDGKSLDEFAAGFGNTDNVLAIVSTLIREEGAAGTTYALVPTMLIALHTNSGARAYVGCLTAKASYVEIDADANVAANTWFLMDDASGFEEIALEAVDVNLLRESCNPPDSDITVDSWSNPFLLLRSYLNGVHLKDYTRAYNYWSTPPNGLGYDEFVRGYANTTDIFAATLLPIQFEGAAGSVYASMKTIVIGTNFGEPPQRFYGCYVARSANAGSELALRAPFWDLNGASIRVAPDDATDIELLTTPCEL